MSYETPQLCNSTGNAHMIVMGNSHLVKSLLEQTARCQQTGKENFFKHLCFIYEDIQQILFL